MKTPSTSRIIPNIVDVVHKSTNVVDENSIASTCGLNFNVFFLFLATRDVVIELGDPWGSVTIERSMLPLKFYHDFNCEVESYSYAFGPCWEPVIAQCNLSKLYDLIFNRLIVVFL